MQATGRLGGPWRDFGVVSSLARREFPAAGLGVSWG